MMMLSNTKALISELRGVVAQTEELLRASANGTGEKITQARERVERSLEAARKDLLHAEQRLADRTKLAALVTDRYVHKHPWNAIGITALVAFLFGCLAARR